MSLPGVELVSKGESLNIRSLILDFYWQLITTSVSNNTFVQPLANTIKTELYQFQNKTITISFPTPLSFSWNTYTDENTVNNQIQNKNCHDNGKIN